MPRFKIGEFVQLNGLLGELHGESHAKVISVVPNKRGITALDEYEIAFEDSTRLRVWSFQLAPAVEPEIRKSKQVR